MVNLLTTYQRVFIDVRKPNEYGQLIDSIQNEQERSRFACGLSTILANYPESVFAEKEKVRFLLNHLASVSGIGEQSTPGWFTDIKGSDDSLSMLSVRQDNKWYDFMACDEYIMLEHRKPSAKHIIGLYGRAGSGKTPTSHKVFKMLKEHYPDHAILFEDEDSEDRYDVKGLFYIGNAKVGFDSQGDPTGRQMDSLDSFVNMGCDIIMVSSRTDGRTVNAIQRFERSHIIHWEPRAIRDDENEHEKVNTKQAKDLFRLIKQYAAIV